MLTGRTGAGPDMEFAAETLRHREFLPQVRLAHHLAAGRASIGFAGRGAGSAGLSGRAGAALAGTGWQALSVPGRQRGARSDLLIAAATPQLDRAGGAAPQRESLGIGIETLRSIGVWMICHAREIRHWSVIAAG